MLPFYPALAFCGSFLLFVIQPIAGRLLLPVFGGAPAVWMTCLLFFQAALVAGYALAHWLPSRFVRFLLPALVLIALVSRTAPVPSDSPVVAILLYLLRAVGPVTIGLGMLGPLLQRWYRDQTGQEPYRLYAWSNAGSLLALLAYPFALEPTTRLAWQFQGWLVLAGTQVVRNVGDLARFGGIVFQILAPLQLALAVFFSALSAASAVAQEKDRRTLDLLLMTRLTDSELVLGKLLAALGVGQAQFFVNSVDTRTQGLDLTASHKAKFGGAQLNTFLALNRSRTRVTGVHAPAALKGYEDVLLSERERLFIEQGGPSLKATLGFEYVRGALTTDLKVIHFGSQTLGTFSGTAAGVPNARYAPRTSADLGLTWAASKAVKVSVGGNNIFNVKPSKQDPNETDNGFIYDSVQFGLNGASYYARLHVSF